MRFCTMQRDFAAKGPANTAKSFPYHECKAKPSIGEFGLPAPGRPPQCPIDACLIALTCRRVALEPGHDVGIQPKGQLLLDRPIEEAALGAGPIEKLRRVGCIDDII